MVHQFLDAHRVVRPNVIDGKTEWFLITWPELRDLIMKIKIFMMRVFGDVSPDHQMHNGVLTRSKKSAMSAAADTTIGT